MVLRVGFTSLLLKNREISSQVHSENYTGWASVQRSSLRWRETHTHISPIRYRNTIFGYTPTTSHVSGTHESATEESRLGCDAVLLG